MIKRTNKLIYLILCAFTAICYSKEYGWVDISKNLPDTPGVASLSDMYWINDNEGWICSSAKGEIYHTSDGGKTFTIQTTQYYTNAIHMLSPTEGYAGGKDGRVYRTTDGGATWDVLGSIGSSLRSISIPASSTTGYCCGDGGKIYSITPTGISSMSTGMVSNLSSISFSGSQGWACGEQVMIHYSSSWSVDQSYPDERYNGIYMINNANGWAVGDNGVIINTSGETNWNYQTNPDTLKRTLLDVFFLDKNEGWAVGNKGVILHTTDGGTTWLLVGDGLTTNMLRSVQFLSPTNGYIIGNNGTFLHYTEITSAVIPKNGKAITDDIIHLNYSNGLVSIKKLKNFPIAKISVMDLQGKLLYTTT